MKEYTLQRDGRGPLIFEGDPIAESVGNRTIDGHAHDLRIYLTPDGRYVLEIAYICSWQKKGGLPPDPSHFYATVHDEPDQVAEALQAHRNRIDEIIVGPPAAVNKGPARRRGLIRQIIGEYDAQVGELLDHEIFAEQL